MLSAKDSDVQVASASADLTTQFYDWERRGRGWLLWNNPVDLEPPCEPLNLAPFWQGTYDDGRRPGVWGRLRELLGGPWAKPPLPPASGEVAAPRFLNRPAAVTEIPVGVPQELTVSSASAEQFLRSLPGSDGPVAFELIGTPKTIGVQFVCREQTASLLRQQLRIHFPASVLMEPGGLLDQERLGDWLVVDFGLSQEFMRPIRTTKSLDPDPLAGMYGILEGLEEGETAVFQVLFQPVRAPWADYLLEAVQDGRGGSFFVNAPDMVTLARSKASAPLFACVVRIGCCARDQDRTLRLAQSLTAALGPLAEGTSNELIPLSNDTYSQADHLADLFSRSSCRSGMILNSRELMALVHLPAVSVQSEKLQRQTKKTRGLPEAARDGTVILGANSHGGKTVEVTLNPEQRSQHCYVIGASGTGKSTLILQLILQDLKAGNGLAVLDPHGDLIDQILERIPVHRLDDVILLDPGDADYPVGFNILSAHSELEKTLLASDLVAVFRRLSTSWGDQMTSVLGNAILAFLESSRGGTLFELRRFLVEADFRREFLATVTDPEILYYWQKEFPLLTGKPQAPLLTRLDSFLRPKLIRHMVVQQESRLDFGAIMNQGKILLARLSEGAIGEENAYLLGTLLVAKLQQLTMSRQEMAEAKRRPFYLYIDEFHHFVTPSMATILSGARKYRLGLILAHQDLRQLSSRSPEVLSSVLSNPYTRICFRVGEQDARALAEGFASFEAKHLQRLGRGESVIRVERADFDFNLETRPLDPVEPKEAARLRQEAISRSRARYARPRREVEAMLRASAEPTKVTEEPHQPQVARPPLTKPRSSKKLRQTTERLAHPVSAKTSKPGTGRGGSQHRYLQTLVKKWADSRGWRAEIEKGVLDRLGSVDVALYKGEQSVACEVGISSPAEEELKNIQKCLAAGFDWVVHISSEPKLTAKVRGLVEGSFSDSEQERVRVGQPDDLLTLLEQLDAKAEASEQIIRGYKVKVQQKAVGEEEKAARRQAVSSVIAKALKRMSKK